MKYKKSLIKYLGSKASISKQILSVIEPEKYHTLVEPFVGSGGFFINTDFEKYILSDINKDLIYLYNSIRYNKEKLISWAKALFDHEKALDREFFLEKRLLFNSSEDPLERSILYLYINRHCFNGITRYNKKGDFNVNVGNFKSKPYFPLDEIGEYSQKLSKADFMVGDYQGIFNEESMKKGVLFYLDPPYLKIKKESFTSYCGDAFTLEDHVRLKDIAVEARSKGAKVLISNNSTEEAMQLYSDATKIHFFEAKRTVSCDSLNRKKVVEIVAEY